MTAFKEWVEDNLSTLEETFIKEKQAEFDEFCLDEFNNYGK